MADPIVHNDVVVTNKVQKVKAPDKGVVTTTTYKGSKAKIEQKFNTLSADTDSLDTLKADWGDTGVPELVVTQDNNTSTSGGPETNVALDTYWELDGNTIQDPVENNDYFNESTETTADCVQALKDYRDNKKSTTATRVRALQLFDDCLSRGQENVPVFNIVLREVKLCARGSSIVPSMENIFEVQSLDTIDPPTYIKTPLEALSFEWLKQPPRIRQVSKTKYQITTEWWSAKKWAGAFYKNGTGDPDELADT